MTWRHLPAHLLTALRVPLAALLWLYPSHPAWFLGVLFAGGVSDALDGLVARALDRDMTGDPRHIGAWLDPVCDKIFAFSCIAAAVVVYRPPPAFAAMLLVREALQIPLLVVYLTSWVPAGRRVSLAAVPAGKLTTVLQFLALVSLVLGSPLFFIAAPLVAVIGLVSVAVFLKRAFAATAPAHGAA